jgi:hypothetical protein
MSTFNELFEDIQKATIAALQALAAHRDTLPNPQIQAALDIHLEATSTHMVELRTMLFMALGGQVEYPAEVLPLEKAIQEVTQFIQNDFENAARNLIGADLEVAQENARRLAGAQLSLQRAQVHATHLLGHLGAAMSTIILTQAPPPPEKPSHLSVVH